MMARRASHAPRNTGMKCSRVPTKIILHHLVHCSQANSGIGITELSGGYRSGRTPGQAEELWVGPMRPELGERHLRHLLANYAAYYNGVRTHLALDKDSPLHRPAQTVGRIASVTWLGGLHRHYVRMA